MVWSMASNVSALSGFVANGHQTIHLVSSAPSKIPYGGFSPVRLQTSFTPQPPSRALARPLIGCHRSCPRPQRFTRIGTCVQAALRSSTRTRWSSGPWLPSRLYCPTGSSLTMATSAPLPATQSAYELSRQAAELPPPAAEGPQFTLPVLLPHAVTLTPVVPTTAFDDAFIVSSAFAIFVVAQQPRHPTNPDQMGRLTELQHSLYGTAWTHCSPCSGQDFYNRACLGWVTPDPKSVMTRRLIAICHRRTSTGWTDSLMGCTRS